MRRLLIAFLFPFVAQASETMTVHYVEVPVSVVGRDGNPVRGLAKANFRLFDGKRRVDITSFDAIDFSSPESLRQNAAQPAAHRSFLLLFDLGSSSPASLQRAQAAAKNFAEKTALPGDLVGVATVEPDRGYRLLANFTTDRASAAEAISHLSSFRSNDPLQIAGTPNLNKHAVDGDGTTATEKDDLSGATQHLKNLARYTQIDDDQFRRQRIHKQIDWLSQLAASLRNLRGRPQIILLSEGFDARMISGSSAKDKNDQNEDADVIMRGKWWLVGGNGQISALDTDRSFGNSASLSTLQAMAQAFQGSGVLLHAIDIHGLRVAGDVVRGAPNGAVDTNEDALFLLTRPTGGQVFHNSNDFSGEFAKLLHQQEVVYVLGFQAPVTNPGKLHTLRVKLEGVPRAATITARQGYFEGGTRLTPFEQTVNAADVILRDIPQSDVRIDALAAAFPSLVGAAQVPVVVDINGADLLKSAKGNDLTLEVFIYAFDEQGAVTQRVYERLAFDLAKVGDKLRQNGVKYFATLALPAGKYAVKTLVRMPATDQKGFSRSDLVVPKAGETALLPPFVLDDPRAWLVVRGAESSGESYPFQVNGEPFIPSAAAHPPSGAVRKIAVFVCNAQPEELTWETTPAATLLAQVKGSAATKLVLQLDDRATRRFGVTIHKQGAALSASTPLN
jgi:VWFA-related protein